MMMSMLKQMSANVTTRSGIIADDKAVLWQYIYSIINDCVRQLYSVENMLDRGV